jgi:hypothetical protein
MRLNKKSTLFFYKSFVEAHRIQTKANSLFDKELNQWLDNRNKRI